MSEEIGFAVIGLGMGKHHCRAITTAPGARLVAVCDLDEERLNATVEEYGCDGCTDFHDLLGRDDIQVINVGKNSATAAVMTSAREGLSALESLICCPPGWHPPRRR